MHSRFRNYYKYSIIPCTDRVDCVTDPDLLHAYFSENSAIFGWVEDYLAPVEGSSSTNDGFVILSRMKSVG